jgi:hypothetical protein
MKIISQSNNTNNSRVTISFSENGVLGNAAKIAGKHGCNMTHNVAVRPIMDENDVFFSESFGTVSFNKGNHTTALTEFLDGKQ